MSAGRWWPTPDGTGTGQRYYTRLVPTQPGASVVTLAEAAGDHAEHGCESDGGPSNPPVHRWRRRHGQRIDRDGQQTWVGALEVGDVAVDRAGAGELRAEKNDDAGEVQEHDERDPGRQRPECRVVIGDAGGIPGEAEAQRSPQHGRHDDAGEHLAPAHAPV